MKNDRLLKLLRKELNLSDVSFSDEEILRVTKGTLLRARIEIGLAKEQFGNIVSDEIKNLRNRLKKYRNKKLNDTIDTIASAYAAAVARKNCPELVKVIYFNTKDCPIACPLEAEWQPIETAPKDGTAVLGYAGETMTTIFWRAAGDDLSLEHFPDKKGYWSVCPGLTMWGSWTPTHWTPLPNKPK